MEDMKNIRKKILAQKDNLSREIELTENYEQIELLEKKYKNIIKSLYSHIKNVSNSEKKIIGKEINDFKDDSRKEIDTLKEKLEKTLLKREVCEVCNIYDYSFVKNNINYGRLHPLMRLYREIENVFMRMGFSIINGPEIELDSNNFEKLNLHINHHARDMQDTFYITEPEILLRSHTSSVQIRMMEQNSPPFKIISPGHVYRVDDIDAQHTPMFYQIEGLVVEEKVSFANLKWLLTELIHSIFGHMVDVRFRPSYYPYTEPSAAIDMSCIVCNKKGCRTCNYSGWITILGAGMVHPNVFKAVNYDFNKYKGLAFGIGLNRLALIFYKLDEIRKLYDNDITLWAQL